MWSNQNAQLSPAEGDVHKSPVTPGIRVPPLHIPEELEKQRASPGVVIQSQDCGKLGPHGSRMAGREGLDHGSIVWCEVPGIKSKKDGFPFGASPGGAPDFGTENPWMKPPWKRLKPTNGSIPENGRVIHIQIYPSCSCKGNTQPRAPGCGASIPMGCTQRHRDRESSLRSDRPSHPRVTGSLESPHTEGCGVNSAL